MTDADTVAALRALGPDDLAALGDAARTILATADDPGAWALFVAALDRACPLAEAACHPVWAELRAESPHAATGIGQGLANGPDA